MSQRRSESTEAYRARTKREYQARKASAPIRGISLSQATGHGKRAKKRSITELRLDFRFKAIREFFFGPRRGAPLPGISGTAEWQGRTYVPENVGHVSIFITHSRSTAIYPDGRVRVGSIDYVYEEAKELGFDITVESGNPPKSVGVRTKSGTVHDILESLGNGVYDTLCNRIVTGTETEDPVTCSQCRKKMG